MDKVFVFDLDGVVTDTAELHYLAWKRLADRHGYPFNREINDAMKGVSRADSLRHILAGDTVPPEKFQAMMKEKNDTYLASLSSLSPEDVLPGMKDFLDHLTEVGAKKAIASASRNARRILERLEMTERFDAISDGNSIVRSKPAPDVFIHAAGQLGASCADVIVFEDADAGIRGAQAAGMATVGIGGHLRGSQPDLLLEATAEVTPQRLASRFEVAL